MMEKKDSFLEFFLQHIGKELIVIFGSITFDKDIIMQASKKGVYVMGWKEWEYMDILNFEDIQAI